MKYKSCVDIEDSLYVGPDELRACCQRFFYDGKIRGDAVLLKIDNNKKPTSEDITKARQELLKKIQNGDEPACKGCRYIHKVDNAPKATHKVKHLSIEHHSVCNLRCNYCSEMYYGGKKPNYKVDELIKDLNDSGSLTECKQVVWGGGEPTADKSFENTLKNIDYSASPKIYHRVFTNSVSYRQPIVDFLKQNKIKIVTSIDAGTRETFTKVRGRDRFIKVLENLKAYSAVRPSSVTIKYIFTEDNFSDNEILEFANKINEYNLTECCFQISYNFKFDAINIKFLKAFILMIHKLKEIGVKKVFIDDHIMARYLTLKENEMKEINYYTAKNNIADTVFNGSQLNDVILYGAGQIAKELITKTNFKKNQNFDIVDSNPEKIGKTFCGKEIKNPNIIDNSNRNVFISAAQSFDDIYSSIEKYDYNTNNIITGMVI